MEEILTDAVIRNELDKLVRRERSKFEQECDSINALDPKDLELSGEPHQRKINDLKEQMVRHKDAGLRKFDQILDYIHATMRQP